MSKDLTRNEFIDFHRRLTSLAPAIGIVIQQVDKAISLDLNFQKQVELGNEDVLKFVAQHEEYRNSFKDFNLGMDKYFVVGEDCDKNNYLNKLYMMWRKYTK